MNIVKSPTSRHDYRFVTGEQKKAVREQSAQDKESYNYSQKEVIRLHTLAFRPKQVVDDWLLKVMVNLYYAECGKAPTEVVVPGAKRADKSLAFHVPVLGVVGLDVVYDQSAEVAYVR